MGSPHDWVYKTALWQRMRALQLKLYPLCALCLKLGELTPATIVDHINPHKGDRNLAFDSENLQSLCEHCHNSHKQAVDNGKPLAGCDINGYPIDRKHPWYTEE